MLLQYIHTPEYALLFCSVGSMDENWLLEFFAKFNL